MAVSSSAGAQSGTANKPAVTAKPNILVILADDLGYADLGCQGCKDVPTPNIDGLAREGIRFTSGYVTAPVCGPSRAGLLSGRYGERFGFEGNIGPNNDAVNPSGIPRTEKIFPERMKAAGYATGMFGKWHVG
jgi:arylsulfatase A-like enzyme